MLLGQEETEYKEVNGMQTSKKENMVWNVEKILRQDLRARKEQWSVTHKVITETTIYSVQLIKDILFTLMFYKEWE